jgi:hypothetical protein
VFRVRTKFTSSLTSHVLSQFAQASKSATEVYRTERAKNQGGFFKAKTMSDANKVKSNTAENLSSGESATGEEFGSARGLVPVLTITSCSALLLYNIEALQGML